MRFKLLAVMIALALAPAVAAQSHHDIFVQPWWEMPAETRMAFVEAIRLGDQLGVDESRLVVEVQPLSWSRDTQLIRVSGAWEPRNLFLYYLNVPGSGLLFLDGTILPLNTLNDDADLVLNAETIGDYIWFMGFFVRGNGGPFLLVETTSDTFLPRLDSTGAEVHEDYAPLSDIPRKLSCDPVAPDGSFRCDGTVYYSNAMFLVEYSVTAGGTLAMPQTRPIAAKLNYTINAPITPGTAEGFRPLP